MSDEKLVALFLTPVGHRMDEKSFPGLWPFHVPALRSEPFNSLEEYDTAIATRAMELAWNYAKSTFGIFSLTTSEEEHMWAYYADNHKGICVDFDPHHAYFNTNPPERILYTDEPVEITINRGWVRFGGHTMKKEDILRKKIDFIPAELFSRKLTSWQSEKEWRITKKLCDADEIKAGNDPVHLYRIPAQAIRGITFGLQANDTSIERALQATKEDTRWEHLWVRRRIQSSTGVMIKQDLTIGHVP